MVSPKALDPRYRAAYSLLSVAQLKASRGVKTNFEFSLFLYYFSYSTGPYVVLLTEIMPNLPITSKPLLSVFKGECERDTVWVIINRSKFK